MCSLRQSSLNDGITRMRCAIHNGRFAELHGGADCEDELSRAYIFGLNQVLKILEAFRLVYQDGLVVF